MASARHFNGSEGVVVSLGSVGAFGPATCACVMKYPGTAGTAMTMFGAGSGNSWNFGISTGNVLSYTGGFAVGTTTVPTGAWVLCAMTKATGSVAVRFHLYRYSTRVWVHENGGSLANSGSPVTQCVIGAKSDGTGAGLNGEIQIIGYWNTDFTDAQIEALEDDGGAWFRSSPKGLWYLNQPATATNVVDNSGFGANQSSLTGTSIVTGNPDFDQPPQMLPGWLA